MGLKVKRKEGEDANVPLSAMIDIVFLLIIFFVVTAALDKEIQDEQIQLANSPHGKVVEKAPKNAFYINVREKGDLTVNGQTVTTAEITNMLYKHMHTFGKSFPIILRCDKRTRHGYIMNAQRAVTDAGLYAVMFNAEKL